MDLYTLEPANYTDYRDFLKARFDTLKLANKRFSLASCAQKSKISKSLLQFIFRKKRHLSLDRMPALAKTLKLNSQEEYFVYLLICKNSSRNPAIQAHFEQILDRIRHEAFKVTSQEPERAKTHNKELYLDYLFMMIQTLARIEEFQEDPEWILKHLKVPGVTADRARDTLQELESKKFLKRDNSGRLRPEKQTMWRPDPYDPTGQKVFTKGAECMAELMQVPALYKPSVYMSMCLAFDEKQLAEAEKVMIELHHKLSHLAQQSENPSAVVQFGNFMLTVARLKR